MQYQHIVVPPHGQKITIKYHGKVMGDTIKGKMEFGENSRDWEAKREKS